MPTYVYKDLETGEIYEFKQSMKDDVLTHHPETGAAMKRVPVAPAIAFKGSGFYATDSRQAASVPAGKTGGVAEAGAKADKPAAKAEASGAAGGGTGK